MGKDYSNEFDTQDVNDNKVLAVLAYIPILFWLPLVAGNGSRFGRFHANQGLILLIFSVALAIVNSIVGLILGWIPILGAIISGLLGLAIGIVELALILYGMINTGSGNAKELPVIGGLVKLIHW
jgi:uncharacterized membrane protein